MTTLETLLVLALLIVVPWAVWSAIDLVALRRHLDDHCNIIDDINGWDVELGDHERRLLNHDARLLALEDARDTTGDLDVPTIYRPVPPDFHTNR